MFSKFVNFVPFDFKISTHIDWTYAMYHTQKRTNQNNVTRVPMATKYRITKHRACFKTVTASISPINT